MRLDCAREQDLLDAIASRRWPERCDASLRDHVTGCPICGDVAEIAGAFAEERDCVWSEADVPAASVVWWRAQLRARAEAARLAGRPIAVAQAVAFVCLVAAACFLLPIVLPPLGAAADSIRAAASWFVPRGTDLSAPWGLGTGSLFLVALVLAPVLLLYFALQDS